MAPAVAVEFVHAASLVLDDLPSMDDAPRRRGRPALHRVHGVATAELAAVALLARAFEIVAEAPDMTPARPRRASAAELAAAVGAAGLLRRARPPTSRPIPPPMTLDDLEAIHARKTGALFVAAVRGGAIAGGAGERLLSSADALRPQPRASRSRSPTTCSTSRAIPERWARTRAATPTAPTSRRSSGRESSHRLVDELLESALAALAPLGRRAAVLADLARVVRDRRS